jgi:hypothetical protein
MTERRVATSLGPGRAGSGPPQPDHEPAAATRSSEPDLDALIE